VIDRGPADGPAPPSADQADETNAHRAAQDFVAVLRALDSEARAEGRTIPTAHEREATIAAFWTAMAEIAASEPHLGNEQLQRCQQEVRHLVNPWLLRSDYWNRSYTKPHGYAGDFRMLEWMYDLEADPFVDPTKPAIVNVLDALYATRAQRPGRLAPAAMVHAGDHSVPRGNVRPGRAGSRHRVWGQPLHPRRDVRARREGSADGDISRSGSGRARIRLQLASGHRSDLVTTGLRSGPAAARAGARSRA
jgi:hypothetical protein